MRTMQLLFCTLTVVLKSHGGDKTSLFLFYDPVQLSHTRKKITPYLVDALHLAA